MQLHIDSLVQEERANKNQIQKLLETKYQLEKWENIKQVKQKINFILFQCDQDQQVDDPQAPVWETGGVPVLRRQQMLHTHGVCSLWGRGHHHGMHGQLENIE